jgi:AcrR family transcriptional regulator
VITTIASMEEPRRPGRPRDTTIDGRALAATRELLVEVGFEATTIQAAAERSGVHASALYRRWPSRIEMIEEAVFPGLNPLGVQPTGDLRRDLRRFIRVYLSAFSTPASQAATAGLLSHHHTHSRTRPPDFYQRVSARPQLKKVLQAAPPESVDPTVDTDDVFDLILGVILTRTLLGHVIPRHAPVERTVELLIRAVRPLT